MNSAMTCAPCSCVSSLVTDALTRLLAVLGAAAPASADGRDLADAVWLAAAGTAHGGADPAYSPRPELPAGPDDLPIVPPVPPATRDAARSDLGKSGVSFYDPDSTTHVRGSPCLWAGLPRCPTAWPLDELCGLSGGAGSAAPVLC